MKTAYSEALKIVPTINKSKWKLGDRLRIAIDDEQHSIREFAEDVDGHRDHEDSYGNYVRAERLRLLLVDLPEYDTLMKLPISYWYTAHKAVEYGMDIEDVLELLLDCFLDTGKMRGCRWLDMRIREATGREKTFYDLVRVGLKWMRYFKPLAMMQISVRNVSEAKLAEKIVYHVGELEKIMLEVK